jgi:hypothetical protein
MNNQHYFQREFMLTVEKIGAPKTVYVADDYGYRFPVPIPVFGGVSISEQEFVDKINKEKGEGTVEPLMLELANKVAPLNGGDPDKILTALIKYRRSRTEWSNPIEDYEAYFLRHAKPEFDQFIDALKGQRLTKWVYAAAAHALLNRVSNLEALHGRKWKTEDALNPEVMSAGVLLQFHNLFQLESWGTDLTPYLNDKNEFTYKALQATDTPVAKEEKAEVLAGK